MTPNAFLELHVTDLLDLQVDYAFLRNSRGYPEKLTGDIDVLIKQSDLRVVYDYYKKLCNEGIRLVQIIPRRQDLYVMLYFPNGGARKFLVLEYYTGVVFRGQVIVAGERLLQDCDVEGIWRHLSERVSISYTFFHYVAYKGYLPEKYKSDFDRHGLDPSVVADVLAFLNTTMNAQQTERLMKDTIGLRDRIRRRISLRKAIWNYADQLLRLRPESFGCVLKVNPENARAVIEFADKYHLYRPTHRYIVRGNPVYSVLLKLIIVALGGLAVLPRASIPSRDSASEYFIKKMIE